MQVMTRCLNVTGCAPDRPSLRWVLLLVLDAPDLELSSDDVASLLACEERDIREATLRRIARGA